MANTDRIALYVGAVAALLVIVFAGTYLYIKRIGATPVVGDVATTTTQLKDLTPLIPQALVQSMRTGQYQAAVDEYERIMQKPDASSDEKALALINVAGARFNITGNADAWIQDIQALKSVVADPSVVIRTRAAALSTLEVAYNYSGRNPAVFAEIYKDGPTKQYLVPNNPDLSAINIGEASYALRPASLSAIYTAQLYAAQYFLNPNQAATTTALYATRAADYLDKAAQAVQREASVTENFEQSSRYFSYMQWKAITQGYLAVEKGDPYTDLFRDSFKQFFEFAATRTNPSTGDSVFFTRFQYARILAALKDVSGEKEQLSLLASELNAMPQGEVSVFVAFLKNERAYRPNDATWKTITNMFSLVPDFQQAVLSRIGTK
jgi:hypothetical protein